jgi:hypothetical protein
MNGLFDYSRISAARAQIAGSLGRHWIKHALTWQ